MLVSNCFGFCDQKQVLYHILLQNVCEITEYRKLFRNNGLRG